MTNKELGQLIFGNPTGDFETEEWADALVEGLLAEIDRVYWNKNQKEWNRCADPSLDGIEFNPYYWGDIESTDPEDVAEREKPNLKFSFSPLEIRWYKHPGRGQSSNLDWSPAEWCAWYVLALRVIRASDDD